MAHRGARFSLGGTALLIAVLSLAFFSDSGVCAEDRETLTGLVVIEGSGDCQVLVRALARAFEQENPGVRIEVPDSTGSRGGLRALAQGKCDLARIARPLSEEDKAGGITAAAFAISPIAFIVNAGNKGVKDINASQVADVYSGRMVSFDRLGGADAKIYPLSREVGDIVHGTLKSAVPDFGDFDPERVKVYYHSQELIADVASHPGALGYVPLPEIAGEHAVVPLRFENVAPTPENVANNSYRLQLECSLAWRIRSSKAAKAFVDFTRSARARGVITALGGEPLGQTRPKGR